MKEPGVRMGNRGSDESGPCSCPISLDPEGSGPKGIGLGNTEKTKFKKGGKTNE